MKTNEEHISRVIARLARVANKFKSLDKKSNDFGTGEALNTPEIHAVQAIGKGWARTANDLASHFGVTKGAVSQIVSKLEMRGYLVRERNPKNGKEKLLALTDKGRTAYEGHEAFHRDMDSQLQDRLRELGLEAVEQVDGLLGLIERHIDKYLYR